MTDMLKRPWYWIIPSALIGFIAGWIGGSLPHWLTIVAWVLAVIAATAVTSAMISYGYEDEKRQHRREMKAAKRRVADYEIAWKLEKQERQKVEKALRVANRLVKD